MAQHVCPGWAGYLLICPLRKLIQSPRKILGSHVEGGMRVLDIGCAMGFFSLPLARMVSPDGQVVCVDVQPKMLEVLERRARKAGLLDRIDARRCGADSLGLDDLSEQVDFALAFAVVHEVPDARKFLSQVGGALRQGGRLLLSEPRWHVSQKDFDLSVSLAEQNGFGLVDRPKIRRSRSVLLEKESSEPAR